MSEKAIRILWSFLGLLSTTFAYSAVLRVTGSEPDDVVIPFASYGPRSVTLFAIPLGASLVIIVLWLTRRYPPRVPDSGWPSRMPTFYFEAEDIKPEHRDGRLYQSIFFVGFIVMPVLAQLFFFRRFLVSGVTAPGGLRFTDWWEHFWPEMSTADWEAVIDGNYKLEELTYYPVLMPWGFLLIESIVIYSFWLTMRHLLRAANPGAVPDGKRATRAHRAVSF